MECKLSAENTRLEEENKRWKEQIQKEREVDRNRRDQESKWFQKYQEKLCGIMGMRYPDQNTFNNFQECIDEFIARVEALIPPDECELCHGTGKVRQTLTTLPNGKCPLCNGTKLQKGKLHPSHYYHEKRNKEGKK